MPTYTPANSISDGPVTNLLSILCILIEICSLAHGGGGGGGGGRALSIFKFGPFIGRFQ